MAIPFFSIDITGSDIYAYLKSAISGNVDLLESKKVMHEQLASRFPNHKVTILPSARLAFYLLLKCSFKHGDEIIFPVLGFPLYVKIALKLGLVPVLVDVEPDNLTIDPEKITASISKKTKAIVVTHLFGHPARLNELTQIASDRNIPIIEDAAQSFDSFMGNQETGTIGWAGIFSCSLMKVPTMLGGGILITKDESLHNQIQLDLKQIYEVGNIGNPFHYHIKGLISILNSSPTFYSVFSHRIFGLLKSRNPALLRSILYSGMGMNGHLFDPSERPSPATYQYIIGARQIERTRTMTLKRRQFSLIIDKELACQSRVRIFAERNGCFWNRQYHVIDLRNSVNMNHIFDNMFRSGVHVMKEDVWDCTKYDLPGVRVSEISVGHDRNLGLLRIPNNSLLSETVIHRMCSTLYKSIGKDSS